MFARLTAGFCLGRSSGGGGGVLLEVLVCTHCYLGVYAGVIYFVHIYIYIYMYIYIHDLLVLDSLLLEGVFDCHLFLVIIIIINDIYKRIISTNG